MFIVILHIQYHFQKTSLCKHFSWQFWYL